MNDCERKPEFTEEDEKHYKRHFESQQEQSNWKQYGKAVRKVNALRLSSQGFALTTAQRSELNSMINSVRAFLAPHED